MGCPVPHHALPSRQPVAAHRLRHAGRDGRRGRRQGPSPGPTRRGALHGDIRFRPDSGPYNRRERCGGPARAVRRVSRGPAWAGAGTGRRDGRGSHRARIHGVRRGDRRGGSVRTRRRRPAPPARRGAGPRPERVRRREGLRGRRPHPLRRGARAPRPRGALPGLARSRSAPQHAGERGTLLLPHRAGRVLVAERAAPALAPEPRQLHHQPRELLPVARRPGRGARGGGVPRLRRRRRALPGGRGGRGDRHRRHGSGARRRAQPTTSCPAWSSAPGTPSSPKGAAGTSGGG